MNADDYKAAYEGGVGADRMALKLPIIPDKVYGDMAEVMLRSLIFWLISLDLS